MYYFGGQHTRQIIIPPAVKGPKILSSHTVRKSFCVGPVWSDCSYCTVHSVKVSTSTPLEFYALTGRILNSFEIYPVVVRLPFELSCPIAFDSYGKMMGGKIG